MFVRPAQAPSAHSGLLTNEAVRGACERYSYYALAALACFRTFAQRRLCASAIRSRASLLKTRLPLLSRLPPALLRASSAFRTRSMSFSRRAYSSRREVTTLFRFVIYNPLMATSLTWDCCLHSVKTRKLEGSTQFAMRQTKIPARSRHSLWCGRRRLGGARRSNARPPEERCARNSASKQSLRRYFLIPHT